MFGSQSKLSSSSSTVTALAAILLLFHLCHSAAAWVQCQDLSICDCLPVAGPASMVTQLDCRDSGLESIPEALAMYTELTHLKLNRNSINTVADDIFAGNTKLELLDLSRNLLTAFPAAAVKPLTRLDRLFMHRNPYSDPRVPLDTFDDMAVLRSLDLRGLEVPGFGLNLSADHFRNLQNLDFLILSFNPPSSANVISWPAAKATFVDQLTFFAAKSLQLPRIPLFISKLPRLDTLNLDVNDITQVMAGDIPDSVTLLDLSLNPLRALGNGAIPLSVTTLSILGTSIREIDLQVFRSLPKLAVLSMTSERNTTHCRLVDGIVDCDCADGLHRSLRGDACTVCPEHVPGFPNSPCTSALQGSSCTVRCDSAITSDGDEGFAVFSCGSDGRWSMTQPFPCATASPVCGSSQSPCTCVGSRVDCSRRNLTAIPSGLGQDTTEIDLSRNSIKTVPHRSFGDLTSLHTINMSHNRITALADGAFAELYSLRSLDLSQNSISGLHGLPFPISYKVQNLDLQGNAISFVEKASALSSTLENLRDRAWASTANGTDTNMLRMANNPLQCRYLVNSFKDEYAHGAVQCECDLLNTTDLPFCPRRPDEFRFECDAGDAVTTIASHSVCDGAPDCLPSNIDEAVCEGTMRVVSASPGCLLASARCSDRGYSCFEMLRLTIARGVVAGWSNIPCDREQCPQFKALLTQRGVMSGAGERIVYDQRQALVTARLALDIGSVEGTPSVTCEFDYHITSGMPAGIVNPPAQSSTAETITTTMFRGVTTTAGNEETPISTATTAVLQDNEKDSGMSMSDQVTIVALVCVLLALALVAVAAFLYCRRLSQIRLEHTWLRSG